MDKWQVYYWKEKSIFSSFLKFWNNHLWHVKNLKKKKKNWKIDVLTSSPFEANHEEMAGTLTGARAVN